MNITSLLDKKNMVNAILRVGGQELEFVDLEIVQEYGQHHHFTVRLDSDIAGKTFMGKPTEQIEMIGSMVVIDIRHGENNGGAYVFKGVVTKVRMTGIDGRNGFLILEGSSPTIMLERGRRMDVYSDMTLRNIFKKLIEGVYTDYMKCVNEPTYENKIDFLMQYNETDWEFLKRIAYLYGENLFYSGSEILFGAYEEWEAIKLTYDKEISDIEFCTRMLPNQSVYYQYVAEQDSFLDKESPDKIENSNPFLDKAAEQNLALTSEKPAVNQIGAPVNDRSGLEELVKRDKTRTAAQTVYVTGKSKTFESTIGRLITICIPGEFSMNKELGTYRVVKSIHRINERLRYSNEFEAVPASLQTMPVAEPKMPVAESVLGHVTSNEDPKNQGRVQVDFAFANQYSKIWMRVMTPDAGSSDAASTNRGLVFIPEKGDQVMVGFEYGDPNRPYVMGSMFHAGNAAGGTSDNHIKSIITRSGNSITFDDEAGSITIKDKQGADSTVTLDGKGNVSVNSNQSITLSTGKSMISMTSAGKITIQGEEVTVNGAVSATIASGAASASFAAEGAKTNVTGTETTVHGGNTTTVSGQTKTMITATGQTVIDGAIVKLN
ncbi:type VI secretion system Vgr family protein [Dysgonomonas sp. 511]|uniref:type VI secretion system Vgr family protein n=1 Tax=Dysgonomonas sp. 511 TaxID=2302930 RepID=UPI0013D3BAC0|nr:phage baseplate assembly protein V [Dysgonomonas sp. 511]NDV78472.1 hypothetical protein [Dysgonomonas sp. 511]